MEDSLLPAQASIDLDAQQQEQSRPPKPQPTTCGPKELKLRVALQDVTICDVTAEVHRNVPREHNGKPPPGPAAQRKLGAQHDVQRIPVNGLLGGLFGTSLFRHDSFPPCMHDVKAGPTASLSMPASPCVLPAPGPPTASFNDLRFVQQIGEGGFGKVYLGYWVRNPGDELRVAIKLATPQPNHDMQQLVAEFQREVVAMSAVPQHPNVLRLVAACTVPPQLALVTDYCAAGSLYNLLHSPRPTGHSWPHLLSICLGVAHGMAHLHKHHVLHRDLKSSNILLDTTCGSSSAKIADFGLARVYRGKQALTGGLGTYQWMAPEVLAHQRYSEKADVYSFGVVLYECCSRQLPYQGMTAVQAAVGVVNHGLRPELPKSAPPDVAALVKECWAAVPDQRPSFEQIAARLKPIIEVVRGCPTHR